MSTPQLIIHFMRHAEPLHKTTCGILTTIRDPGISPRGIKQCLSFSTEFNNQAKNISYILCSPMNRTISTACIALSSCLDPPHNIPIICLPEIQNLDSGVNGQGMDFEDLKIAYSVGPVDITSFGREGWNEKSLGSGWDSQEMPWRVDYMRGFLRGLWAGSGMKRTVEVVVVSHGSFLRGFVKDVRFKDVVLSTYVLDDSKPSGFRKIEEEELAALRAGKDERLAALPAVGADINDD